MIEIIQFAKRHDFGMIGKHLLEHRRTERGKPTIKICLIFDSNLSDSGSISTAFIMSNNR